ncbi:hypothetical protein B0T09DRAFT_141738 [Sordaria sp. MPI-SDFR-AT-0083]|nr:hypothetical protein B0T09DRAFT_141738 [Sordaria sp. MPI-SDFR-AT-0083]
MTVVCHTVWKKPLFILLLWAMRNGPWGDGLTGVPPPTNPNDKKRTSQVQLSRCNLPTVTLDGTVLCEKTVRQLWELRGRLIQGYCRYIFTIRESICTQN